MSVSDVNLTSSTSNSQLFVIYAGGSIISSVSATAATSIIVTNLHMERMNSLCNKTSEILQFSVPSLTGYASISFLNVSCSEVNSSSSTSYSRLYVVNVGTIAMPAPSSSSSSSIVACNWQLNKINSHTYTDSTIFMFQAYLSIRNYTVLAFVNMSISDINSTSSKSYSQIFLVSTGSVVAATSASAANLSFNNFSSLTALASPMSSITVRNARMERVSSQNTGAVEIYLFRVLQSITNYTTLALSNMSVSDVNSTSSNSYSIAYLFYSGGSLAAPSSTPSSITITSVVIEKVNSWGYAASTIYAFNVATSITNYSTLSFVEMSLLDVNSTSWNSYSQLYLFFSGGSVISSTSTMTVSNLRMERVNSSGSAESKIYAFFVAASVTSFATLIFSNMSVWDVNSTSSNSYSKIFLVSTGSVVAATSTAATNFSFNNLTMRSLDAVAATDARVVLFNVDVPSSIQGFDSVTFADAIMQNILTQSTNNSFVMAFWSGGFLNCNIIRITNSQLTYVVSTSSSGSAMASLVSVQSSTKNVRSVEINDNLISNISVIAPSQYGKLFLMNSTFDQVEMISLRNNRILLNSLPSLSSPNISVSMVPLSIASGALNLDISNSTLEIQHQHWYKICSPTNCSLVRINDIQNNHVKTNISISESSVSSPSSSFISFANFGNTTANRSVAILNFVLKKNYFLNFSEIVNSSIFGFDNSSHLPRLAFVEVKCNHWSRKVDRMLSRQLIAANSAEKVEQFVAWSCLSESKSASATASTTSSNSASVSSHSASHLTASNLGTASTTPSQLTFTGDATSSASQCTHSISADASNTKSLDLTPSSPKISFSCSSSVSRMKSSSFSSSRSESAIVPPPPYVSPLREVYETMVTTSSLLSLASMSSTNVLGASRARSALGSFSDLVAGTCSLDFQSLSDLENSPPDRSSSPARFKLNGNYLTGQAVGNLVVIVGVGAVWMLGYVVVNGRSDDENQKLKKKHKKKHNRKDKKKIVEVIIASNAHGMVLFVLMLLLGPTLTSSALSLIGEIVVDGRTITVLSVVCVVLSWLFLLFFGLGWSMWKLVHVRDFGDDVFELLEQNDSDRKEKFWFRRFVEYTTSPFGEWEFIGHRKKEKMQFELARPLIESFTNKWPKFIVIDVGVIVILALAEVIPKMIPDNSSACFIRGVVVCFVLSLHVLLVVYYRLLYTDRMSNTVGCFVDTLSVVVVAGAMSIDENNVSQIKGWSRVAVVQAGVQMLISALQVIEVLLPVWDGGIELAKKYCSLKSKKKKDEVNKTRNHHHYVTDLAQMMNYEEEDHSFSSPLLQEMAVISQTENVEIQSQNNKKGKLVTKRKLIGNQNSKSEPSLAASN